MSWILLGSALVVAIGCVVFLVPQAEVHGQPPPSGAPQRRSDRTTWAV